MKLLNRILAASLTAFLLPAYAQQVFDEDQIPVITNGKLSDMTENTIKMRNNASNGDPLDTKISELTEELSPTSGDFLLCENESGELRKCDVGDLVDGAGFLTSEVDGSTTNEIQDLTLSGNQLSLTNSGVNVDLSVYLDDTQLDQAAIESLGFVTGNHTVDTNTQLSEAQVDAFVANNGFLSSEVDGSNTNEIQTLSINSDQLSLSNGGGTVTLPSGGGGDVIDDLTPQLGGDLDLNGFKLTSDSQEQGSAFSRSGSFTYTGANDLAAFAVVSDPSSGNLNTPTFSARTTTNLNSQGEAIQAGRDGDAVSFFSVEYSSDIGLQKPSIVFGSGSGARDTNLYRDTANTLKTDDSLVVDGDLTINGAINGLPQATYVYPVWAEENAALNANTYEWAFGNGANTPQFGGITIYERPSHDCGIVALTIRSSASSTAQVALVIDGVIQGNDGRITKTNASSAVQEIPRIALNSDTLINFRTISASGAGQPHTVTAWIECTYPLQ